MCKFCKAIDQHWAPFAAGDQVAEHEIYHNDAVCVYPQSGEVIHFSETLVSLKEKPSHAKASRGEVVRFFQQVTFRSN